MSQLSKKRSTSFIHHANPRAIRTISDNLITVLPSHITKVTVLCIGSDRSTGDALGPMTGTLFKRMNPKHLNVQGTLTNPVHALNLEIILNKINTKQSTTFIIAIDASLGQLKSVGYIQSGNGSILPGAALKKQLPAVGDAFITGVVNISGMMEHSVLQSTRLSLVYDMAHTLAKTLYHVDLWLQQYQLNRRKLDNPIIKIHNQYTI